METNVLTITDGTTTFELEEGQSYAGWTFVKARLESPYYVFGTHVFVFQKGALVREIRNLQWQGERVMCTDGIWGVHECPSELALFGRRSTKVIKNASRQAAQTGD